MTEQGVKIKVLKSQLSKLTNKKVILSEGTRKALSDVVPGETFEIISDAIAQVGGFPKRIKTGTFKAVKKNNMTVVGISGTGERIPFKFANKGGHYRSESSNPVVMVIDVDENFVPEKRTKGTAKTVKTAMKELSLEQVKEFARVVREVNTSLTELGYTRETIENFLVQFVKLV